MPPVLHLRDAHLGFGGKPLLDGAELALEAGERVALVGRNGSGKSTLLKILAGVVEADRAEIFRQPGAAIRYLPQEPDLSGHATVLDYVTAGLAVGDDPRQATRLLAQLDLSGDQAPAQLSGGGARRAALARLLAPAPDILLLDEPTNHLDLPSIEWLEATLAATNAAMIIVSHDRRFLENLTDAAVWLDRGKTRKLRRGFRHFEAWRDGLIEAEEEMLHKLDRKIAAETEWLHKGVTARRRRNQGRLRALHALHTKRRDHDRVQGLADMPTPEAAPSGKLALEAEGISKSFDGAPVIQDFSLRVRRGDRIGIVGPNGAGKTTMLRLLLGELAPDTGRVRTGARMDIATLDQGRESLNPAMSLGDALTGGGDQVMVGGKPKHVIGYMKDFLFDPKQRPMAVSALSGGERGRLMLARALARPSNLMVLDEPTNDLDMETLDLLQDLLADYQGALLLVSHDRDFLDRIVTATVAFEGEGCWRVYAGGYSDMARAKAAGGRGENTPSSPAPDSSSPVATKTPARRAAKPGKAGKLGYRQTRALAELPGEIAGLESRINKLQAALADKDLFATDPARFRKLANALEEATTRHAAAENEWLALEILREETGGG